MWLSKLRIQNVKTFSDTGELLLSKGINLLMGRNNAGKSTILRCIYDLQADPTNRNAFANANCRIGATDFEIDYSLDNYASYITTEEEQPKSSSIVIRTHRGAPPRLVSVHGTPNRNITFRIKNAEPDNWIYPFLCGRKADSYDENVTADKMVAVNENNRMLNAKVDRILTYDHPHREAYECICKAVFGRVIASYPSKSGKRAGISAGSSDIPLTALGEGAKSLLGLVADLCVANEGKLFLLEEPENDIHPQGLKEILNVILQKSEKNQFIISTHSNIVARHLGTASNAKLFSLKLDYSNGVPTTGISEVKTTEERLHLLKTLGYALWDFELWSGYLILEESTAERIIRDFLIPHFTPKLKGKLKTIAANGTSDLEARFVDFHRLFVFLHTTPVYKMRAWAIADNDSSGVEVINNLRDRFRDWPADHFKTWNVTSFERYYPPKFQDKVGELLALPHGREKQDQKKALVEEVMTWADSNPSEAKTAFCSCANDVIDFLKNLENEFE